VLEFFDSLSLSESSASLFSDFDSLKDSSEVSGEPGYYPHLFLKFYPSPTLALTQPWSLYHNGERGRWCG